MMTAHPDAISPDLKDPDLYVDSVPHGIFARLRREEPVYWNAEQDGPGFWALTRQAEITAVSRQPALFSSAYDHGGHRIFNENEVGLTGAGEAAIGIPFISIDPPVHTQFRRVVMPALTPARLEGIEERINARCADLIAGIPMNEAVDIVPLLTAPLPLMTLAELLDVPSDIWPKLYDWTNAFVGEDDPDFRNSPAAMAQTLSEFFAFAKDLFDRRRAQPGVDLATVLANATIQGQPASFKEFVANLILALVGGNETTRNSLSHSVVAFANNPEQWTVIREQPQILAAAVKEMVRHASPVMHMRRTATADTTLANRKIAKGDKVVMWYVSGNRDEATTVPAGRGTGWLVDGELDVVTLSISAAQLRSSAVPDQFRRMRFAFSDPLAVALSRQVLSELYAPAAPGRDAYVAALVNALKAHILRGSSTAGADEIPTSGFSAYRLHRVMNMVLQHPEGVYTLEEMAADVGVTPAYFCRVFRKATGASPHQYVMKAKLERARQMLRESRMQVATIAECLGFTSQSHFTRAFRRFAGQTPSEFRRRADEAGSFDDTKESPR